MLKELLVRGLIGGLIVSAFAVVGDLLKPKSFAGLFGAAPSVALATLVLAASTEGMQYAAAEGRSMMGGAAAFFVYASWVSWVMMRHRFGALSVTLLSLLIWLAVAFGLWQMWLR